MKIGDTVYFVIEIRHLDGSGETTHEVGSGRVVSFDSSTVCVMERRDICDRLLFRPVTHVTRNQVEAELWALAC